MFWFNGFVASKEPFYSFGGRGGGAFIRLSFQDVDRWVKKWCTLHGARLFCPSFPKPKAHFVSPKRRSMTARFIWRTGCLDLSIKSREGWGRGRGGFNHEKMQQNKKNEPSMSDTKIPPPLPPRYINRLHFLYLFYPLGNYFKFIWTRSTTIRKIGVGTVETNSII